MKLPASVLLFLAATPALAHSGHGKPGFVHSHELADWFASGALILYGVAVIGIACWWLVRIWKR